MTTWKVTIVHKGKTIELELEARSYPDAFIKAEKLCPGGRIISIRTSPDKV